jgi:hypothetical protein
MAMEKLAGRKSSVSGRVHLGTTRSSQKKVKVGVPILERVLETGGFAVRDNFSQDHCFRN